MTRDLGTPLENCIGVVELERAQYINVINDMI